MINKFTQKAESTLLEALNFSRSLGHSYIGTEHLLYALASSKDSVASKILAAKGAHAPRIKQDIIDYMGVGNESSVSSKDMTPRLKGIIEEAAVESTRARNKYVGTEHLLVALLNQRDCIGVRLLEQNGISIPDLKADLSLYLGTTQKTAASPKQTEDEKKSKKHPLSSFGKDLTAAAVDGKTDPVIGRDEQIERLVRILCRRQKNNPCIIGEPGVGKTAIVEGLALRIAEGRVPEELIKKRIITLDVPSMIAGAKYRGEFEERIKSVVEEVKSDPNIILFIDEVHMLVGAGAAEGAIDAANILKPPLSRGEIHVIGATTPSEYRSHIEKDSALERRFQQVELPEPTEKEAISILKGLRHKYEEHHKIRISDEAICSAVRLSVRYIPDRRLPDKAIDIIDEAAAKLRISLEENDQSASGTSLESLERQKELALIEGDIDVAEDIARRERELSSDIYHREAQSCKESLLCEEDVAQIITEHTGIPCNKLLSNDAERLCELEERLGERVIGQERAIAAVADAIRRGRLGLASHERPIGSFLFLGGTGVGKTELCRALADILFESKNSLIRIDMSEYMEKHSVSKLIGAPPGYVGYGEGGVLTERVRRNPYSVILLDEIEKAHPDVLDLLLQILEDGILSNSSGRRVHFSSCVLIMTSNLITANDRSTNVLGFSDNNEKETVYDIRSSKKLCSFFKPEFLNRVDDIIVFDTLEYDDLEKIASIMLKDLKNRACELGITLEISDAVAGAICLKCSDKHRSLGARPLRRQIIDSIESPLSKLLLNESTRCIRIDFDGTDISVHPLDRPVCALVK